MSGMGNEYTKELEKAMLKNFNIQKVLSKTVTSWPAHLDKSTVVMPWYLKPFAKKVRAIASHYFTKGYFSNTTGATNTVTIKRPKAYEDKT